MYFICYHTMMIKRILFFLALLFIAFFAIRFVDEWTTDRLVHMIKKSTVGEWFSRSETWSTRSWWTLVINTGNRALIETGTHVTLEVDVPNELQDRVKITISELEQAIENLPTKEPSNNNTNTSNNDTTNDGSSIPIRIINTGNIDDNIDLWKPGNEITNENNFSGNNGNNQTIPDGLSEEDYQAIQDLLSNINGW